MRKIRRNIRTGFFILLGLFLFLLGYFCYGVLFYGDRWFANSYNVRVRLNQIEPDIIPGDILDRKGTVLATTAKKTIKGENGEELEYYYRTYHKDARATAHVVGFHNPQYGRLGAEAFHIRYLMGYNNNFLERIYQKAFLPRENGNNIQLTVDLDLQRYISEKLGNRKGSVVLLNPQTGEILAMVSHPSFDPNNMETVGEDNLVNRATQGLYPPGSIFKIITAASALENGDDLKNMVYDCSGTSYIGQAQINCYGKEAHGALDTAHALAVSCNGFFAHLGIRTGWEKLLRTGNLFGFNQDFLFDDIKVVASRLPLSSKVSKEELAWDAVGQGKVLVTPLHMAMVAAAIANRGVMMEPKLIYSVIGRKGQIQKQLEPEVFATVLSPENAMLLQSMMELVVEEGTGKGARQGDIRLAGKTGTAEVQSTDGQKAQDHSWFIGFGPLDEPSLAIAVIIENGGTGGASAAPLAGEILYKAMQMGY